MNVDLTVDTDAGLVRGVLARGVPTWRGIPYAAPPVGELRLRAPQPVTPWAGVHDASDWGNGAVQDPKALFIRPGKKQLPSEDCLTLNIQAPPVPGSKRPVMVFIHGGAYLVGSSSMGLYDGRRLVRRGGIVYVSINYRLGALGYLDFTQFSTPERPFDSNLGLRDQVAALEWVQRNIEAFGGDPDNVTIFGESAGGSAVVALMATPATKGLFAHAIAESPAVDLVSSPAQADTFAQDFVALLGAGSAGHTRLPVDKRLPVDRERADREPVDKAAAVEALTTATAADLWQASRRVTGKTMSTQPGLSPFAPTVDGNFLPEHPIDAFTAGDVHPVPLIIGSNKREGTLFPRLLDSLPTDPERIEKYFHATDPEAMARILTHYPGYPATAAAVDFGGDSILWAPTVELAQAYCSIAPTFMYRFDYAPRIMKWLGLEATHAFEMLAVFGYGAGAVGRALTLPGGRRGMRAVTDTVQREWLSFARTGKPTAAWPAYDTVARKTMIIDDPAGLAHDPNRARRLAWVGHTGYRKLPAH